MICSPILSPKVILLGSILVNLSPLIKLALVKFVKFGFKVIFLVVFPVTVRFPSLVISFILLFKLLLILVISSFLQIYHRYKFLKT